MGPKRGGFLTRRSPQLILSLSLSLQLSLSLTLCHVRARPNGSTLNDGFRFVTEVFGYQGIVVVQSI